MDGAGRWPPRFRIEANRWRYSHVTHLAPRRLEVPLMSAVCIFARSLKAAWETEGGATDSTGSETHRGAADVGDRNPRDAFYLILVGHRVLVDHCDLLRIVLYVQKLHSLGVHLVS